jgi:hypothetical protein
VFGDELFAQGEVGSFVDVGRAGLATKEDRRPPARLDSAQRQRVCCGARVVVVVVVVVRWVR